MNRIVCSDIARGVATTEETTPMRALQSDTEVLVKIDLQVKKVTNNIYIDLICLSQYHTQWRTLLQYIGLG